MAKMIRKKFKKFGRILAFNGPIFAGVRRMARLTDDLSGLAVDAANGAVGRVRVRFLFWKLEKLELSEGGIDTEALGYLDDPAAKAAMTAVELSRFSTREMWLRERLRICAPRSKYPL